MSLVNPLKHRGIIALLLLYFLALYLIYLNDLKLAGPVQAAHVGFLLCGVTALIFLGLGIRRKALRPTGNASRTNTAETAIPPSYPPPLPQQRTFADLFQHLRDHPPRCLAGFTVRPTELPDFEFDGHLSLSQLDEELRADVSAPEHLNPVFALSCKCGGNRHYVHGYRWRNPEYPTQPLFLSPLSLECASCGKTTEFFDTDVHGYDAELGMGGGTYRARGEQVVCDCPDCGRQPLEVYTRFEYPDDLFDSACIEFVDREHNLFTWFTASGKCPKCSKMLTVADYECA